jgi:hypothetical protein
VLPIQSRFALVVVVSSTASASAAYTAAASSAAAAAAAACEAGEPSPSLVRVRPGNEALSSLSDRSEKKIQNEST